MEAGALGEPQINSIVRQHHVRGGVRLLGYKNTFPLCYPIFIGPFAYEYLVLLTQRALLSNF